MRSGCGASGSSPPKLTSLLTPVARWLGASRADLDVLQAWADRYGTGVLGQWDQQARLTLDLDARTGRLIRVTTWAGLAPLLVATASAEMIDAVVARLWGP